MTITDLEYLAYITPFDNIPSILERGLLCHDHAAQWRKTDVSDPSVQERRGKAVPGGDRLHRYTNVYLNGRNAMLYRVSVGQNISVAVIAIRRSLVLDTDAIVSDENAACGTVRFYSAAEGLAVLDKDEVFLENWNDPDPIQKERKKRRMMAELLIPERIGPENILGAYVRDEAARQNLRLTVSQEHLKVETNPHLFFLLPS